MKNMFNSILLAAMLLPLVSVSEEIRDPAKMPTDEFLACARRSNPVATYAMLNGTLQHRRRGKNSITVPIYFGVILHPERTAGQIILDKKEGYLLGQAKGTGLTSVVPMSKNSSDLLGFVGVRASDLTMSFLFCKPEKEFERETVSGLIKCRVLYLNDTENKEFIKVWISEKHAFPLQAEFYRYGEKEPFRLLEASGFTQKNDLYYVKKIRLEGPGWKTRIDFDSDSAEIDKLDPTKPPRVIKPLGGK